MSNYVREKPYVDEKAYALFELGLRDIEAVKAYLLRETKNDPTEEAKENHMDRLARQMLKDYYNGDITFIKTTKSKAKTYYDQLKRNCAGMETVYEDVIISIVGENGLNVLRKEHMIETCAVFNNRKA